MPRAKAAKARTAKQLAPVPPNMAWISAYLTVKDPAIAIAFYETAFGFKKGMAMPDKSGNILHAELTYEDNMLMLGPESEQMQCKSPSSIGGTPMTIYVYTTDVNALTERARKAGAKIVQEPADQFWGDRTVIIVDPDGFRWMWAQRLRAFDPKHGS